MEPHPGKAPIEGNRRPSRPPFTIGCRAAVAAAVTIAVVAPLALTGTAQAAVGGPSATLALASATIAAGAQPVVTFLASDVPTGSVIYLQRASGNNQAWQNVGLMTADSATVRAPADQAGDYRYRILVADGGAAVAASPAVALSVTGPPGSAGCAACADAKKALPWLVPFVEPLIEDVAQQAWEYVVGILASIFAF
jgi:hypothetical protein